MKKAFLVLLAAAVGIALAAAVLYPRSLSKQVAAAARAVAIDNPFCYFDGTYSPSGVPTVRLMSDNRAPLALRADLSNHLASEPAKPFHFGIIVLRDDGGNGPGYEVWGWSYREGAFWRLPAPAPRSQSAFTLAYPGDDPAAECRAILADNGG